MTNDNLFNAINLFYLMALLVVIAFFLAYIVFKLSGRNQQRKKPT